MTSLFFSSFNLQHSDSSDVLYDAKIKLSRQSITEIEGLLEGKESWRTGALDNAISQILVDIRPHDSEVWRWRFEDTFGVDLDTLIKVSFRCSCNSLSFFFSRAYCSEKVLQHVCCAVSKECCFSCCFFRDGCVPVS